MIVQHFGNAQCTSISFWPSVRQYSIDQEQIHIFVFCNRVNNCFSVSVTFQSAISSFFLHLILKVAKMSTTVSGNITSCTISRARYTSTIQLQTRLFRPPLLWTWVPRLQSIRFHFVNTLLPKYFGHLRPPQCSCSKKRAWVCGDLVGRPWETKETQLDHLWPQSFLTTRSSTIMLRYSFSF